MKKKYVPTFGDGVFVGIGCMVVLALLLGFVIVPLVKAMLDIHEAAERINKGQTTQTIYMQDGYTVPRTPEPICPPNTLCGPVSVK